MYSACNCFQTFHNCFNLAPITNLFFFNCSVIHFNQQTVTFTLYNVVEGKELCISWLPLHKMYAWNTDLWEITALQQGFYFFSSFLWKRHDPLFLFHMMKGCFVIGRDWSCGSIEVTKFCKLIKWVIRKAPLSFRLRWAKKNFWINKELKCNDFSKICLM